MNTPALVPSNFRCAASSTASKSSPALARPSPASSCLTCTLTGPVSLGWLVTCPASVEQQRGLQTQTPVSTPSNLHPSTCQTSRMGEPANRGQPIEALQQHVHLAERGSKAAACQHL
eukprot:2877670-Amphidinium_carterae.1